MSPELIDLNVDNIEHLLTLRYNEFFSKYSTVPTRLTISWRAYRLLQLRMLLAGDQLRHNYNHDDEEFLGCKVSIDCDILENLLYYTEGKP